MRGIIKAPFLEKRDGAFYSVCQKEVKGAKPIQVAASVGLAVA